MPHSKRKAYNEHGKKKKKQQGLDVRLFPNWRSHPKSCARQARRIWVFIVQPPSSPQFRSR